MATVPIPQTTLTVGPHDFGATPVANTVALAVLSVDRTVVNGFNSQPATTQASIEVHESTDSGATWVMLAAADIVGGVYQDRHGVTFTASTLTINLPPGTSRQVKARIVVSGASVAVGGSLTIS